MTNLNSTEEEIIRQIIEEAPNLNIELFNKAVLIASEAHGQQKRLSGENYIIHPLNVALILAKMKSDNDTICAAVLHDTLEDTNLTDQDIIKDFGDTIFRLVEGVTKLDTFHYVRNKNRIIKQAENFRKLLLYTIKDVRVLLIKLADRLHNIRTLDFMDKEKQEKIAQETIEIYAPLANRFGLSIIKSELENTSFKVLNPIDFEAISSMIEANSVNHNIYIKNIIKATVEVLAKYDIDFDISGRTKDYYSIYQKHLRKNISYQEIYDLIAIRIVTTSVEMCYRVLGIIHSIFQPIDKRFKDYISNPKENNYQSLHTLVIGPDARKIEFQIRTNEMHLIAEEGIAAHWRYKENHLNFNHDFVKQIEKIRSFISLTNVEEDFLESFKSNFLLDEVIVVTPRGDYIKLPKDSTAIDFAFALHTDIGLTCTAARINSEFVPLRTILHNGDTVSIITSVNANPSYDWLRFVKSAKAKSNIKAYFKKKQLADSILLGKEIFNKRIRKSPFKIKEECDILKLAQHFKYPNIPEFYAGLGSGQLDFSDVLNYFADDKEKVLENNHTEEKTINNSQSLQDTIYLDDINNLMVNFAKCCNPHFGDDILGYVTRGRGITIHRADCHNKNFQKILENEGDRVFKISWDKEKIIRRPKTIEIAGYNNKIIFYDIVQIINNFNIDVLENNYSTKGDTFKYTLVFDSNHFKNLSILIQALKRIDGVNKVKYFDS